MSQTREKAAPGRKSSGDIPVAHFVCNTCQGPTRPGVKAVCGHTVVHGSVRGRRSQLCVVCDDMLADHLKIHE